MSTMFAGPFVPTGHDPGFPLDWSLDEDTLSLPHDLGQGMTQIDSVLEDEANLWSAYSSRLDVANLSPEPHSHQAPAASQGSASLSPAGPIFTPTSSLLDYDEDTTVEDAGLENASPSPESSGLSADDYVHVNGRGDEMSTCSGSAFSKAPRPQGVISSPSSHLALRLPQQQSMHTTSHALQYPQWQRMSSSPLDTSMEDSFVPYTSSADALPPVASWAEEDLLSNSSGFNTSFTDQAYGTPFRAIYHGTFQPMPSTSTGLGLTSQQTMTVNGRDIAFCPFTNAQLDLSTAHAGAHTLQSQGAGQYLQCNCGNQSTVPAQLPFNTFAQQQMQQRIIPSQAQHEPPYSHIDRSMPGTDDPIITAPANRLIKQQGHLDYSSSQRLSTSGARRRHDPSSFAPSTTVMQATRPLLKPDPGHPTHGPIRSSQMDRAKRGGRQKNTHLSTETRKKSHEMRKKGACWRCAMQRDQCDPGEPCQRCINGASKNQRQFFECDRSKLPDFVHDFLPPPASMKKPHEKQAIEDTVKSDVLRWDKEHQLDLYLTVCYGEPLVWKCYEFVPRTPELIRQFQFIQDPTTNRQVRHLKWSPPFGLLKIDTSDDHHFNAYLERLMQPKYLSEFGWCFYEEEFQSQQSQFQPRLLTTMCQLYMSTTDTNLHALLKDIIRMLLITYIMGHTLCIVESNLPTVISSVRHSRTPAQCPKFTSPKLANRQIKFFFSLLRCQIYEKILKWQQQTFHTTGKKENTWIHSFCVMLGFAMVLEEVQRLMQIQAETAAEQGDMSWAEANSQARNAFDRIDDRYNLLIGLFKCKYRDKTWTDNGSFGPHTPRLSELAQVKFLADVRFLLLKDQTHLRSRENVPFGRETQCLYTTRQTARFLLPFLTLQGY